MWDLPAPGLEPVFSALAGRFLITVPPGKSNQVFICLGLTNSLPNQHNFKDTLNSVAFGTNLFSLPNNLNSTAPVLISTAVTNRSSPSLMCVIVQRLCVKAYFPEGGSGLLVLVSDRPPSRLSG